MMMMMMMMMDWVSENGNVQLEEGQQ